MVGANSCVCGRTFPPAGGTEGRLAGGDPDLLRQRGSGRSVRCVGMELGVQWHLVCLHMVSQGKCLLGPAYWWL